MAIEVPRLPLEVGETISVEQIFKHVGKRLVEQGLVPEEFASDEWATQMAAELAAELDSAPDGESTHDKKK